MNAIVKVFALTAAATTCAWLAWAADDAMKFHVNVNMVQVRATITDGAGRYVPDLKPGDFRVLENGIEQKVNDLISPARSEKADNTVFVLFDTSNRMFDDFVYAEGAVADFIHGLAESDAVAVYSFSRNVTRLASPTHDRLAALVGLRNAVAGDETAMYDAILVTLRDAAKVRGNKVVVIFSNGPDDASFLAPYDVRVVAENAGIPIYVVSTRDRRTLSSAALFDMTEKTGGRAYYAATWTKQKLAFQSIAEDLNNSYVISYYPEQGGADGGFRKIDVKIVTDKQHQYRVRMRRGYWSHTD